MRRRRRRAAAHRRGGLGRAERTPVAVEGAARARARQARATRCDRSKRRRLWRRPIRGSPTALRARRSKRACRPNSISSARWSLRLATRRSSRALSRRGSRAGMAREAERELAALVARSPGWIDGHVQLAQLRSMLGMTGRTAELIERALAGSPRATELWLALFDLHIKSEAFGRLDAAIAAATEAGNRGESARSLRGRRRRASWDGPRKPIGCSAGGPTVASGSGVSATCSEAAARTMRFR